MVSQQVSHFGISQQGIPRYPTVTKSFWQENEFFSSYYETSEKPRGIAEWFWSMLSNKREEKEFDVVKK